MIRQSGGFKTVKIVQPISYSFKASICNNNWLFEELRAVYLVHPKVSSQTSAIFLTLVL